VVNDVEVEDAPHLVVRDRVVGHGRRGEVGRCGVQVPQAPCRAAKLGRAIVPIGAPLDEAGKGPPGRARRDAAVARGGTDDLGGRDTATPQVVLEAELEPDPVAAWVAPAATQYVLRFVGIPHQEVQVPGTAGQQAGQRGPTQRPPG